MRSRDIVEQFRVRTIPEASKHLPYHTSSQVHSRWTVRPARAWMKDALEMRLDFFRRARKLSYRRHTHGGIVVLPTRLIPASD
ncbi:hypothetical protein AB1N83_003920 [Pleurotus pulmonarius]